MDNEVDNAGEKQFVHFDLGGNNGGQWGEGGGNAVFFLQIWGWTMGCHGFPVAWSTESSKTDQIQPKHILYHLFGKISETSKTNTDPIDVYIHPTTSPRYVKQID